MSKENNKIFSCIMFAGALLWSVVILLFVKHEDAGFYYWSGFGFGIFAFLVCGCISLLAKYHVNRDTTEITMIPNYVTSIYVIFAVIYNAVFIGLGEGDAKAIIVIGNCVAFILYVLILYYLAQYAHRASSLSDRIAEKTTQYQKIKLTISSILALCKEDVVKQKILELKQMVDYRNNLAQSVTTDEEALLFKQVQEIEIALKNDEDVDSIIEKITLAEQTLKLQNSKLAVMK